MDEPQPDETVPQQEAKVTPFTWRWERVVPDDGNPLIVLHLGLVTGTTVVAFTPDEGELFASQIRDQAALARVVGAGSGVVIPEA